VVNGLSGMERKPSSNPNHIFGKVENLLSFTEKVIRLRGKEGGREGGRNVLVPAGAAPSQPLPPTAGRDGGKEGWWEGGTVGRSDGGKEGCWEGGVIGRWDGRKEGWWEGGVVMVAPLGCTHCPRTTVGSPEFLWSLSAHAPQPHDQRGCSLDKKMCKSIETLIITMQDRWFLSSASLILSFCEPSLERI